MAADFDTFMAVSKFLLGIGTPDAPELASLNPSLGRRYLAALEDWARSSDGVTADSVTDLLDRWTRDRGNLDGFLKAVFLDEDRTDLGAVAEQIVLGWYTARVGGKPVDADASDRALVWSVSYAHPQGVPKSFGYWQYSPLAVGTETGPGER